MLNPLGRQRIALVAKVAALLAVSSLAGTGSASEREEELVQPSGRYLVPAGASTSHVETYREIQVPAEHVTGRPILPSDSQDDPGCLDTPDLALAIDLDRDGEEEFLRVAPRETHFQWDEDADQEVVYEIDGILSTAPKDGRELHRFRILEVDGESCLKAILAFDAAPDTTILVVEIWTEQRTASANGSSSLYFYRSSKGNIEHLLTLERVAGVVADSAMGGIWTETRLALLVGDEGLRFRVETAEESGRSEPGGGSWRERTENLFYLSFDTQTRTLSCVGARCPASARELVVQAKLALSAWSPAR